MANYTFISVWGLTAPIERVWDEISRPERYPEWFPYVAYAEQVQPGNEQGVGEVTRSLWTTALPYGFVFESRTTRSERPHLLELAASGDLEGTGRWELSAYSDVTTVRYYWTVRTAKRWMNLLAPLARPAFAWNHAVLMRSGGQGLARQLGVELVCNQSFAEESTNPFVPLSTVAGMITLGMLAARGARRLASRR